MDMQKERELLKKHTYPDDDLLDRDDLSVCEKWFLMGYREAAKWQAAKASAVPDGFVLIERNLIQSIYQSCNNALDINNIDIFKGLTMAIIDDMESMIEAAQEQS